MLEAPEAKFYAGQLDRTLTGKSVETVIVGFTPHKFTFFNKPAEDFEKILAGRRITGAGSVGGIVELMAGSVSVAFTDGVNFRYIGPSGNLPKSHQFLLGFTDQSCLAVSVRMYAGIVCFTDGSPEGDLAEYYRTARTKPQLLSDEFTRDYFLSVVTSPEVQNISVKALLATRQRFPGLGNGVLQDILYNAGIHPKTKISKLPEARIDELYRSVRETLQEMYDRGGRDSETDIFGNRGGYKATLSKDTAGGACPACRATIIKENYMGGSIYYCPGCQPYLK